MAKNNLLDILLDIGKDVTKKIITVLEPIFGFKMDIYYPQSPESNSVYDSDDNKYDYLPTPNEKGARYVALNLFDEEFFLGDITYDPFPTSQAYILTHGKKIFPLNSKVIIYKGDSQYKGRIVDHKVLNGRNSPIYIKHLIAPWS